MVSRLQVVDEETDAAAPQSAATQAGITMLVTGLKALSQRALVALANLFCLVSVGSAFWLWSSTPTPSTYQIISLTIYALFILAANVIVRRY